MLDKVKAEEILNKYNQEHLLEFYEELSDKEQKELINQIEKYRL